MRTKICQRCGAEYQPTGSGQKYCAACAPIKKSEINRRSYFAHREERMAGTSKWKKGHPERVASYQRKYFYGITKEEYQAILELQGGKCACCGRPDSGVKNRRQLFVDHDHTTGKIRGLLCNQCNKDVGWIESAGTNGREELLREYLRQFS